MNFIPPRLRSGFDLQRAAHELLEAHRARAILRGRRALLGALLEHGRATADDVRGVVELPADVDPKLFGAVPSTLVRLGIIEPDGFAKSRRREAHARPLTVWRLLDRGAAVCWLGMHPDEPDPPTQAEAFDEPTLFDFANENGGPGAGTPGDACN